MNRIDSSFRDPDGYMFEYNGELYRAVNLSYQLAYDHLLSSGLYQSLVDRGLMIPFDEVDPALFGLTGLYKVLKPVMIKFISYPYEWAFNMLKDAALLTLEIQKLALNHGMSLKDASAFNVQFQNGKPIFIDTLSFELYKVNRPWVAYRQFCQHFLVPLALMAHVDSSFNRMFITHIDGIPLDLAKKILPFRSRFNLGLYLHIFLHAKAQKKFKNSSISVTGDKRKFSLVSMRILVEGLKSTVEKQSWRPRGTEWANYTDKGVHDQKYIEFKKKVISELLDEAKPKTIWDLGANTGFYSRLAAQKGIDVISCDLDPACVKINYINVKKNKEINVLPILMDLLNVSPSIGWRGCERISFYGRKHPELIMALAIIHHLAISANIPFESIAEFFVGLSNRLIIEFVPKDDEKVRLLLLNREDIFPEYTQSRFEEVFSNYYNIEKCIHSKHNNRVFYFMNKR